jgi:hypothetical protein
MRNVVRQRRGKMRQEDGQKARHIVVFVFSHLPLPLPFSLKPRISKRKPRLKLVICGQSFLPSLPPMWTFSCGFPQVPPSETASPRNSRPLSLQLRYRSIRRHQCSTSTSCRCRSSSTAHLLPPSWRSQRTQRRFLPLRQPMISTTLLHPTNPKTQLPNPYAQQHSPAPQAYCLQQSRTRCLGRMLGLLAFFQDLEAQLRCLVHTQGRTSYFSSY